MLRKHVIVDTALDGRNDNSARFVRCMIDGREMSTARRDPDPYIRSTTMHRNNPVPASHRGLMGQCRRVAKTELDVRLTSHTTTSVKPRIEDLFQATTVLVLLLLHVPQ